MIPKPRTEHGWHSLANFGGLLWIKLQPTEKMNQIPDPSKNARALPASLLRLLVWHTGMMRRGFRRRGDPLAVGGRRGKLCQRRKQWRRHRYHRWRRARRRVQRPGRGDCGRLALSRRRARRRRRVYKARRSPKLSPLLQFVAGPNTELALPTTTYPS